MAARSGAGASSGGPFGAQRIDASPFLVAAAGCVQDRLALEPGVDGRAQWMGQARPGCSQAGLFRSAAEAFRSHGMIPQASDGHFGERPRERRLANVWPGCARACSRRCLGTRDETTRGSERLDPRAAVDVVDVVSQHETEALAAVAWEAFGGAYIGEPGPGDQPVGRPHPRVARRCQGVQHGIGPGRQMAVQEHLAA
jgi:hypothetical protein